MSRQLLPVALDVSGRACLVVGGGSVAARKAVSLVECGAEVTIIAPHVARQWPIIRPQPGRELVRFLEKNACKYLQRVFAAGDTRGFALVFACTDNRAVNEEIAREAKLNGAWCNIANDAEASDFHNMATIRRGEICLGVSTSGGSPALSRHLKSEIENFIGPEYAQLLQWMSEEREAVKAQGSQKLRAKFWRSIFRSEVLGKLKAGDVENARAEFKSLRAAFGDDEILE